MFQILPEVANTVCVFPEVANTIAIHCPYLHLSRSGLFDLFPEAAYAIVPRPRHHHDPLAAIVPRQHALVLQALGDIVILMMMMMIMMIMMIECIMVATFR